MPYSQKKLTCLSLFSKIGRPIYTGEKQTKSGIWRYLPSISLEFYRNITLCHSAVGLGTKLAFFTAYGAPHSYSLERRNSDGLSEKTDKVAEARRAGAASRWAGLGDKPYR